LAILSPVALHHDAYAIFSRADALRIEDTKRSPGTEANKVTRTISSDTYYAQNYALKYPITLEDRENADPITQTPSKNRTSSMTVFAISQTNFVLIGRTG
jgi:hypothetical protein